MSTRSAGLELLANARRLVERGWCRGADARDAGGTPVEPWDAEASTWSLLGAIVAVLEARGPANDVPLGDLAAALFALSHHVDDDSLAAWNDAPERSQDDVVNALVVAAELYEAPERAYR